MKINWILPFTGKTGGIVVVLEHARQLRRLGHDVALYYPLLPYRQFLFTQKNPLKKYLGGQLRPFLANLWRRQARITWFPDPMDVIPVPWIGDRSIRNADATLATAWPTARSVAGLSPRKGRKYYFVQHYEVWNSDPALVDASYRLPLGIITIAPWLTALMREKFGRETVAEVHNGIDLDFWSPPARKGWGSPGVLMLHHDLPWKGTADGLRILEGVHARFPSVPIRLFGLGPFPGKPAWVEYHQDPPKEALRELYRRSTVFLSPSHTEGWHLPPMEAMASQCAVVATRVGCIPTLKNGENLLDFAPGDLEGMAGAAEGLLADAGRCRAVAMAGFATIREYGWERQGRRLERALLAERPAPDAGQVMEVPPSKP